MTQVSDQERHRRVVEEGSKRKRDLAGHARLLAARAQAEDLADRGAPPAADVWAAALERLRESVPESTYRLWIEPLTAVAALDDTLYVSAPEGIRAWAERRYSGLIAAALADISPYTQVSFAAAPGWSA